MSAEPAMIETVMTATPPLATPLSTRLRVGRDGGLLSHMSVWENLVLPLDYHCLSTRHLADDARLLFELCGEDERAVGRLMNSYPDSLSSYEKRLVGFVRGMLLEPEVLVLCDVFDGLSSQELEKALRWERVFYLRFPFRVLSFPEREPGQAGQSGGAR